ncbi:hypothetical protein HZC30_08275 [Candidatus Woesearchaeota archaeon]|nr:hypothetical protein [Candidatus Woesearchaeota archaeon]
MHPKIHNAICNLAALATVLGLTAGAGGLFYQSCLKKTTLEDATVTSKTTTYGVDDSYTVLEFTDIKLDKYAHCLSFSDPVEIGDRFKSLTYRHNFLLCGIVVDYKKARDYNTEVRLPYENHFNWDTPP